MTNKSLTLLLCLLLVACGGEGNNHGYGYEYDAITESGIRIRYGGLYDQSEATPEWFENTYQEVQSCAGITAPGPLVVFVDPPLYDENGNRRSGMTYMDTGLIVLVTRAIVKHEFIHYLLLMNGFSNEKNKKHESNLFGTCG